MATVPDYLSNSGPHPSRLANIRNGSQMNTPRARSVSVLLTLAFLAVPPCPALASDLDCNGIVDGADLALLLAEWGRSSPSR